MLFRIHLLNVYKKQVGDIHQLPERIKPGLPAGKRLSGCVNDRADAPLLRFPEQFQKKPHLQQRLSAGNGNSSLTAPVVSVTLRLVQQFICRTPVGRPSVPGIGVVTEFAAHGTSLQENNIPDSRTVY